MPPIKKRTPIESITIKLTDGRIKVISGAELEDPQGGVLVWNQFGAKTVMKEYYDKHQPGSGKAKKTEDLWDGKAPGQTEEPAVMYKPICIPDCWP
jgi:hypothetical protein